MNTLDPTVAYVYGLRQTKITKLNVTVPQLTFTVWSGEWFLATAVPQSHQSTYVLCLGISLQFQIVGENLECILLLPTKYRAQIEGLVGNYNGIPGDDLLNRVTGQSIMIATSNGANSSLNDTDILNACLSCEFDPGSTNRSHLRHCQFQGDWTMTIALQTLCLSCRTNCSTGTSTIQRFSKA